MGSFYNVLGLRLPNNMSIIKPSSHCFNCQHPLKGLDLIPILSYLFLRGKCRYCGSKISIFYPFIEIFTGVLFAVSYYSYGFSFELGIALTLTSLLMVVIVSDLNYLMIPDSIIVASAVLIIIFTIFITGFKGTLLAISSGIIMFLSMYLIMIIGKLIFKKEALGGADVKLMFVTGLVLKPILGISSIFLASFIALPVSIILMIKNKDNVVPFGPFLVIGLLLIYFTKIDVSDIYEFLKI